jgi:hypothetical protein
MPTVYRKNVVLQIGIVLMPVRILLNESKFKSSSYQGVGNEEFIFLFFSQQCQLTLFIFLVIVKGVITFTILYTTIIFWKRSTV